MSAKDINIYETKDYGFKSKPAGISKKEWSQDKYMHYENSLAAAKTFKFNAEQNKIARDFNALEAQKSRDWQTQMSNTSHQREVKDLKAAGLNPVLSANNGAQSYTTSAASVAGASGKADSDASAIAMYGSGYLSSQAQKYSANQSAAAMRYSAQMAYAAAQTSAYAQMYAADKHLEGQKYSADQSYNATKYSVDYSRNGSVAGTVGSLLSRVIDEAKQVGVKDGATALHYAFDKVGLGNHDINYYQDGNGNKWAVSELNERGWAMIRSVLYRARYDTSNAAVNALIAVMNGNTNGIIQLNKFHRRNG